MKFLSIVLWILVFNLVIAVIGSLNLIPSPANYPIKVSGLEPKEILIGNTGNAEWGDNESLLYKIETFNTDESYLTKSLSGTNSFGTVNDFVTGIWLFIGIFSKGTISMETTYKDVFSKGDNFAKVDLSYFVSFIDAEQECFEMGGGNPAVSYTTYIPSERLRYYNFEPYDSDGNTIMMCSYKTWTSNILLKLVSVIINLMFLIAFFQILSGRNLETLQ